MGKITIAQRRLATKKVFKRNTLFFYAIPHIWLVNGFKLSVTRFSTLLYLFLKNSAWAPYEQAKNGFASTTRAHKFQISSRKRHSPFKVSCPFVFALNQRTGTCHEVCLAWADSVPGVAVPVLLCRLVGVHQQGGELGLQGLHNTHEVTMVLL